MLDAFDMTALAMGGLVALLVGAMLATDYTRFWDHAMKGIGSPTSVTIIVILMVVGMLSQLIKDTNVSSGFVWIADMVGLSGALLTLFTFVAVGLVAMATGSSIGTMFTAFPIFYPAGVLLGADPAFLAGAIVSGAILGDNLAPISDTTIISATNQRFRRKEGSADIGGVVRSRAKYAAIAAVVSAVGFYLFGGTGGSGSFSSEVVGATADPAGLIMLIPVGIMVVVAFVTRDIFKAVTVGLILGSITAVATNLLAPSDIVGATDGAPTGFLVAGVQNMLPTVALVIAVFGIMGVLTGAGVLDRAVTALSTGRLSNTPRGAEIAIGGGITLTTLLFGGVNSASMMTFGPVVDELGARHQLHPYRRSNVMDCFAMGISSVVPGVSAFLLIGAMLTAGHEGVPEVGMTSLFVAVLYPLVLTVVMIVAVLTGWGRRFEGPDGEPVREQPAPVAAAAEVS
ncbi:Na+/H+ antiporter NhaC family protein [Ornithinimicrobium cavernae]|uniref:Na+/H+ antiporter NhaC family protein n=1 Tax=Ornithinimicrobium cavernae TaxID=2666047 RepID=UPI003B01B45C